MKIFVSHAHSDAKELKKLKEQMAHYDIHLFLAHDNIQPGSQWNEVLKKELRDCNAILYIGNDESRKSDFCDQELGFALGLGKDVIPVLTDKDINSPWGFIADRHATMCDSAANLKFYILRDEFFNSIAEENRRKLKEIAGVNGFYLSDSYVSDYITLIPKIVWNGNEHVYWDDHGFLTSFMISINNLVVAEVRIGYSGQAEKKHTMDMLLGYFTHLGKSMFSTIKYFDNFLLGHEASGLINSCLNCFAVKDRGAVNYKIINSELYNKFNDQGVAIKSLCRDM